MTYQTEFDPEYAPSSDVVEWLTKNGFVDQSWHNDAHPSWNKGTVTVWATSQSVADAEGDTPYCIERVGEDCSHLEDTTFRTFKHWEECALEIEHITENGWLNQ